MIDDKNQKIPLWRDNRFWRIALQVLVIIIFVVAVSIMISNLSRNLAQQGTKLGFSFLDNEAGFSISESLIPYQANDSYTKVLLAGLINSLRVMILGIFFTTIVGIVAGIASFSENWLLRNLNRVYVEVVRNTPLLLQLFFWYFAVFFNLPRPQEKLELPGPIFMSKRGIAIPWPENTINVWLWLIVLFLGAVIILFVWQWRNKLMTETGVNGQPQLIAIISIVIIELLIIIFALGWQAPMATETGSTEGGLNLTLELSALLVGLVFYTGAFISEIVRSGIQAVPKEQWEAAKSLGLKSDLVMRFVIFPQALRVIIPPLNSQYMNLAKNSSLAIAIGYPDLYAVANTTYNQTGRPVEVFILIMAIYLSINLIISVSMNFLNKSVQLKER
ncbi:MAG: ABC transporter permease subunit [Trichodesmium sp. St15_bin1_1]|nr:ABC transporter permease subunit [Trichodesmium sp. St18_bin1]MDE5088487.1 ABC transporter permease subunit [Trichodesmium sp. St16_bin2-tuft]MDE5105544.1 ABC transporter permease subunit [Trichodesmium sp. St17_bin3_1_1]MDE5114355.1 ABC transporter permease subunit [Trichodesmium sp. St15_bin1_1]MDE5119996.1 ABC transporter permease subunit [Trichodesmium sp. St19_bin1]